MIANPDLQRLITDILRVQTDVDIAERERCKVESRLTDVEADFKLLMKKNLTSPSKGQNSRTEIDTLRNELNNINSQLSMKFFTTTVC